MIATAAASCLSSGILLAVLLANSGPKSSTPDSFETGTVEQEREDSFEDRMAMLQRRHRCNQALKVNDRSQRWCQDDANITWFYQDYGFETTKQAIDGQIAKLQEQQKLLDDGIIASLPTQKQIDTYHFQEAEFDHILRQSKRQFDEGLRKLELLTKQRSRDVALERLEDDQ